MSAFRSVVAVAAVAGACAWIAARGCATSTHTEQRGPREVATTTLLGRGVSYVFDPKAGKIVVKTHDGSFDREIDVALVLDGVPRPLEIARAPIRTQEGELGLPMHFDFHDALASGSLAFRLDPSSDALLATLSVFALAEPGADTPESWGEHSIALRMELPAMANRAFVSGVGELSDLGVVSGSILSIEGQSRALAVVSSHGSLQVEGISEEPSAPGAPMRIAVTSPAERVVASHRILTDLRVVLAADSAAIWGLAHQVAGDVTAKVKGIVTGTHERAQVFGLDAEDAPQLVVTAGGDGRFAVDAPKSVVRWYAALDASRTSAVTAFVPGTPWDLRLDVAPGGELRVRIVDADTAGPLTARLIVHGIDGTLDPSFGPDYRASGAGPLVDALRGEVKTPLPAGRYRVAATKGIEWSIDAKTVDVLPGTSTSIELAPRHVVPTPGFIGCDLHVHARPSFDSPVLPEDRVLSLVAAGIDFAVPSEHNIVGDYAPALATLGFTHDLATVNGVEVTTYNPRFGHFGVFPYPPKTKVPPYRATSPAALFAAARRGDPSRILQVNHPRLPMAIGYFEVYHFDANTPRAPPGMRLDFDSIEVYNGYDLARPERVDAVMRDWFGLLNQGRRYVATGSSDSHRIQYQWAGYPRTMVNVGPSTSPLDPLAVVASLKAGHAFVTSGPMIELSLAGASPGDEVTTTADPLPLKLRIRAAPWIDVTSVELLVGGKVVQSISVSPSATKLGPELGSLEEAEQRTVRLDVARSLEVGGENTWVVVVVRGTRRLDDVLPFMPVQPMAFTNPVWITRDKARRRPALPRR